MGDTLAGDEGSITESFSIDAKIIKPREKQDVGDPKGREGQRRECHNMRQTQEK